LSDGNRLVACHDILCQPGRRQSGRRKAAGAHVSPSKLTGVLKHSFITAGVCAFALAGAAQRSSADMVRFTAGTFVMGTDPATVDALMARFNTRRREIFLAELPAHPVTLAGFFLDTTEVTNAAFKRFLDGHPDWTHERMSADRHNGDYLKTWSGNVYPPGEGDFPVTFITWQAAAAYCESLEKRLPTEAEWEFAAGGGKAIEFPWGNEMPDKTKANWSGTGLGKGAAVGSFAPSATGLYDMAGNVWEFVRDKWRDSYADTAESPDRRVIRGGSFEGAAINLRIRYRDSHPEKGAGPHVGFRCARSA
jgi:formylglycine-generating enzyme required for sulfatase activity